MGLTPGQRVGSYEIVELLAAGGMGEVYRARDARLGRDVAVKVLHDDVRADPDRLARFEREARAVAALSDPNVLAIFEIGTDQGAPFIVTELLEGATLRDRLGGGALPWRKACELAAQIAAGVAAAHGGGILHRDLKPENIFVTRDGRAKLLDFGLARVAVPATGAESTLAQTEAGAVLGTAGYMAPEQVRGRPIDERADIFALGAVIYEMLSGRRAFDGETRSDREHAILHADPLELPVTVSAPIGKIVRRCLEKEPAERFVSARDVGFALQALLETSDVSGTTEPSSAPPPPPRWRGLVAIGVAVIATAAAVYAVRPEPAPRPAPVLAAPLTFVPITFRRGDCLQARFAPDGTTIVYAARWDGEPPVIFAATPNNPENRQLFTIGAQLLAISASGEIALQLPDSKTLARASLAGGAPRPLLEDIEAADWIPGTGELAVVRSVHGRWVAEFPAGHPVFENDEPISGVRVSRDGSRLALVVSDNSRFKLVVVDATGAATTLTGRWRNMSGIAWSPDDREVWFTGGEEEVMSALYAVDRAGHRRELYRAPGSLGLHDVATDGRILLSRQTRMLRAAARRVGEAAEREVTWFDWSVPMELSASGEVLLFNELGDAAPRGLDGSLSFVRRLDGSPPVKLQDADALTISPDGTSVLGFDPSVTGLPERLLLVPTGTGSPRAVRQGPIEIYKNARFFPDGRRAVLVGIEPGPRRTTRLYVQDLPDGEPRPVTPPGTAFVDVTNPVSPDGAWLFARDEARTFRLYPVDGGAAREIPGLQPDDVPLRFTKEGGVFVWRGEHLTASVYAVDLATGAWELRHTITPPDPAGVRGPPSVILTADGQTYVYSYQQVLSQLFVVSGVN